MQKEKNRPTKLIYNAFSRKNKEKTMNYDQLQPNLIISQMEERLLELKEALKKLNDTNSRQTSNNYSLRIAQKNGHPDYYYINKDTPQHKVNASVQNLKCSLQMHWRNMESRIVMNTRSHFIETTAPAQVKTHQLQPPSTQISYASTSEPARNSFGSILVSWIHQNMFRMQFQN